MREGLPLLMDMLEALVRSFGLSRVQTMLAEIAAKRRNRPRHAGGRLPLR